MLLCPLSDAAPMQQQGQAECLAQAGEEEMQLGDVSGAPSAGVRRGECPLEVVTPLNHKNCLCLCGQKAAALSILIILQISARVSSDQTLSGDSAGCCY